MTTVLQALAQADFTSSDGIPAGYSDWRFVVQVAKAPSSALLGTMVLGDPLTEITWYDITNDVEGIQIERGASAGSRPGAGQLSLRIRNDSGNHHPSKSIYHGPGTLVRAVLGPAPSYLGAIFTGLTIAWNESSDGVNGSKWIDVVALETTSLLPEVDNPEISPVGAGEAISARRSRILAAAAWPFALTLAVSSPRSGWTFQATSLASDALTEILLTGDSITAVVHATKTGAVIFRDRNYGYIDDITPAATGLRTLGTDVPVVADSIVTANDDDRILGEISVARAGGTAVTYVKSGIQGRYQKRSTQRYDLITQDPGSNADLSAYAADVLDNAAQTYRVESLGLDTGHGAQVWKFLRYMDLGTSVNVNKPETATTGVNFTGYQVCGYTLNIEPQSLTSVHISATIETDAIGSTTSWSAYS